MKHVLLRDVESIMLSNSGHIVVRTIQGESYQTKGIISFTKDSLYGDLKQL